MQVRCIGLLCFFLLSSASLWAQFNRPVYDTVTTQGIRYKAELSGIASTSNRTPFWLRSNQFGTVPLESPAGIISLGAIGLWGDATQNRKPYFKASVEAVGNATRNSRFVLPEAYAAIRLGHGELYIGRRKEINGITDTLLTSGSYAWSGNAVPITQVRIGTKDYAPLKFTKGVVSVNAFFSHGWFTNTDSMQNVYLHAKALYVRIGKPTWKVRFYGGMSHYVQWGGYSPYLKEPFAKNGHLASGWEAYKLALLPRATDNKSGNLTTFDTLNRAGNHLGSIDLALELNFERSNILLYIQRPWEDMSGVVFGNLPDGIYGVRWKNKTQCKDNQFQIQQVTAEFMTTMDQSGYKLPKGQDDYFTNYQYLDGWSHQKRVIGTPFFTRWMDTKASLYNLPAGRPRMMISSNRTQLIHIGVYTIVSARNSIRLLLSQSWNYGRPRRPEPIRSYKQFSGLLELNSQISKDKKTRVTISCVFDHGDWLSNSIGGLISISRYF